MTLGQLLPAVVLFKWQRVYFKSPGMMQAAVFLQYGFNGQILVCTEFVNWPVIV